MANETLRRNLDRAFDPGPDFPDPLLLSRTMATLDAEAKIGGRVRERRVIALLGPRTMALVAALLAVAIVVSLVFAARTLHLISIVPANHGPVGRGIVTNPVSFTCSLPVAVGLYPSAFVQIQLPDGLMVNESTLPAKWDRKGSYDVQAGKWVPVGPGSISPDGKEYAYDTGVVESVGVGNATIHVVDVATGNDRQVWAASVTSPPSWPQTTGAGGAQVLGFLSDGVYFRRNPEVVPGSDQPPPEVWVVDPAHPGAAHRIGTIPISWYFPPLISPLGAFAVVNNGVEHMDLATGVVTTWLISPITSFMNLLGVDDQGDPILEFYNRVMLLTGPNQSMQIADVPFVSETATGDSHGIWFGEAGSIWLYDRSLGLRKVFSMPPNLLPSPAPGIVLTTPDQLSVIGPCT